MGRTPVATERPLAHVKKWAVKVEGGVPQLADYTVAALMALVFTGPGVGRAARSRAAPVLRAFGLFVAYAVLVNGAYAALLRERTFLQAACFYLYDVLLLLLFVTLHTLYGERLLRVTVHAVAASVFIQVLLSPLATVSTWERQTLFFANENQLGYFALLAATLFFLGTQRFHVNVVYQACFYLAVGYLTILSVSRAALSGLALFGVLVFLQRPAWAVGAAAVAGLALLASLGLPPEAGPDLLDRLEKRLVSGGGSDTLAKRGYDRITNHPEYLVVGAGEGDYERFQSELRPTSEIHSSYGTLLFCYGVVGAALFASGLVEVSRRCGPKLALYLLPIFFVYGSAHQGLRFSLFWVLLGFLSCLGPRDEGGMRDEG